jgi:hypothetical protein
MIVAQCEHNHQCNKNECNDPFDEIGHLLASVFEFLLQIDILCLQENTTNSLSPHTSTQNHLSPGEDHELAFLLRYTITSVERQKMNNRETETRNEHREARKYLGDALIIFHSHAHLTSMRLDTRGVSGLPGHFVREHAPEQASI